jgi:hypothetical protein
LRAAVYQARSGPDVLGEVERFFAAQGDGGDGAVDEDAALEFPETALVCD